MAAVPVIGVVDVGLGFLASMDDFEIAVFFLDVMDPGSKQCSRFSHSFIFRHQPMSD